MCKGPEEPFGIGIQSTNVRTSYFCSPAKSATVEGCSTSLYEMRQRFRDSSACNRALPRHYLPLPSIVDFLRTDKKAKYTVVCTLINTYTNSNTEK